MYECISGGGLPGAGAGAPDASLLAQGLAMRDALAADLQRLDDIAVSCVASRHAALPAALAGVRCIHAGGDYEAGAAADFLAREARHHDRVWVIAPESDDLLATLAGAVGAERWIGCTTPAIRVAGSKSATRQRLAAGIAVPASWRPGEPEPADGSGWIVKPDDGAGSVGAHRHADFASAREDLLARLARGVASTLEAWIEGIPLSLSLLCRDGHAELLAVNRQRIAAGVGSAVVYQGVDIGVTPVAGPIGRRLAALAQQIAAAVPGLAGYVGVDVVWRAPSPSRQAADRGRPVVIEINPRVTCAYVGLSAALGRNLAGEILQANGAEPTIDPAAKYVIPAKAGIHGCSAMDRRQPSPPTPAPRPRGGIALPPRFGGGEHAPRNPAYAPQAGEGRLDPPLSPWGERVRANDISAISLPV